MVGAGGVEYATDRRRSASVLSLARRLCPVSAGDWVLGPVGVPDEGWLVSVARSQVGGRWCVGVAEGVVFATGMGARFEPGCAGSAE